jgi:hypothetical protein
VSTRRHQPAACAAASRAPPPLDRCARADPHSLEFAERHRFLGRASEAQIESFHYEFKQLYHEHHLNMAHNEAERLRRCLADVALRAVQPFLKQ